MVCCNVFKVACNTKCFLQQEKTVFKAIPMNENPRLASSLGTDYEYLHTSGHCDMKSLRELFHLLSPMSIIPIHTEEPEAFANLFCDEFSITVLNDGESVTLSGDRPV